MLAGTMATKKTKKASKSRETVTKKPKAAAKKKPQTAPKKKASKAAAKKAPKATPKKASKAAPKKASKAAPKKATKAVAANAKKKPVAPKRAGSKARPAKKSAASKAPVVHRRDATGHLDPQYAATLREKGSEGHTKDRDDAFIGRSGRSSDGLAEEMGEAWVESATSGEDANEAAFNQDVPEDEGGPFVTTTAGQEFAEGTDASNPETSEREPFPKT
jgi:hypothetical protein